MRSLVSQENPARANLTPDDREFGNLELSRVHSPQPNNC
ncbi:hypothetical protein AVDCRST_MAG92-2815 [uncultured Coleofasciculus sp.]|uniref:Uncharacterized protein n=1 Tax=uncultured Coleofasciculus sp. TaxID=1267456 RepID=A0A6J4J692_9CYAN|nr:hypothetical protein AVDCRST_MAG92-2815 [uncultured Coleofasciculus sp.]